MIPTHQLKGTKNNEILVQRLGVLNEYDFREPHRHDYFEFFFFEKGGGYHKIDFIDFPIESQSVHIVAPGQVHQVYRELDSSGYVFLFQLTALEAPKLIENFLYEHAFLSADELSPTYRIEDEQFAYLAGNVKNIKEYFQSDSAIDKLRLQNDIQSLCVECMRQKNLVSSKDSVYIQFRKSLKENFRTLKKVKDYANLLNISESKLNETVKKQTGSTASEVIYTQIIMEAKRLLITGISIKETAYELLFEDPAHFSKFFKSQTGLSPSEFREST